MIKDIFREYDIRGLVGEQLNDASVKAIGKALGEQIKKSGAKRVSVGYDARTHAPMLFSALVSGLNAQGLELFDIGLAPTPVGYFSVFSGEFDANVMITGSHNPKEYNGFKITIGTDSFFGKDLEALGAVVEGMLKADPLSANITTDKRAQKFDILSKYEDFYAKNFSHLKGFALPFVCDFGNGAAGVAASRIIKALNLNAKMLYAEPDGNFPNHHPDPSIEANLADLKAQLKASGAKIGFGFDGDGDRIAVLCGERSIKGDELAYLYALNMKNPRVLGEVKCSQNMYDEINKLGSAFMGKTGHSNIKKAMKELNIDMAAEVSGHIFFKERYFGFDDALYAMVRALELLYKGIDFESELDKLPKLYSTDEIKVEATESTKFAVIERIKAELKNADLPEILDIVDIDGLRVRFEAGWALVRASNTTPVLVTRFEASSERDLADIRECFSKLIYKVKAEF
ncbi:MAG: phosphomannomutase/phosphoglucomutase [Campylobacter sp.]|uniref:phosphomannomutase/phosphoglucomutase n=1 Tax=Campylobacter sp. TaxID=205 RepID=UPI002AA6DE12|nr:phosphomannomutase/phosphoglucomutase [Campylobacter sp.]MCI6578778.1 phosphomannomutase/phosphoglucomutase [Campylobacter sp.]MCI7013879.1 phosphomannomutase/phosphoglucomutase [Campylobacter sp.]